MLSHRKRLLPTNFLIAAAAAAVVTLGSCDSLIAGSIVTTGPGDPLLAPDTAGNIGARIRWGANGWEGAVRRGAPIVGSHQVPASIDGGNPAWTVGDNYKFQVNWNSANGTMSIGIDFNQDSNFAANEKASYDFDGTDLNKGASRVGFGYYGLQIFGNQDLSTATSTITNLSINGTPQMGFSPAAGATITQQFKDSGNALLSSINISGTITFTTLGTGSERPAWDFTLLGNAPVPPPIPEPATVSAMLAGLAGLLVARRRASKS